MDCGDESIVGHNHAMRQKRQGRLDLQRRENFQQRYGPPKNLGGQCSPRLSHVSYETKTAAKRTVVELLLSAAAVPRHVSARELE